MTDKQKPVGDWATDFDLYDPDYTADPSPIWQDLQNRCPIAHTERWGGLWMTTKYADAQALVKETQVLSNRQVSLAPMAEHIDLLADYHSWITPPISNDPPDHTELRRLILPFFNPKAVEAYRPFTEALCHQLIDAFIDKGACDAAADYAQQLTPRVIGHMLGIDPARSDEYVGWVQDFIEFGFTDIERRNASRRAMLDFFDELVQQRRHAPGDDYISMLLAKEWRGEPLSDKMVVNFCLLLLIAGIDTTWSSLGSALYHFAEHEGDRHRMVAEPTLFPSAIEELLRFHSPVSVGRIAMADLQYGDVEIKRGDRVMINFPAANRDPDAFDRPDDVILDRQKNRHFAFGIGVHRCAGSNLARMEMDVALRVWFERIPEFRLADDAEVAWSAGQVRGARRVPVVF